MKQAGYDTAFIYGGDGFFDNMNYFFGANGYRLVDLPRQLAAGKKPTFANAWGYVTRTRSLGLSRRPIRPMRRVSHSIIL